jgi:peptidoglycan-associated lipoprotein
MIMKRRFWTGLALLLVVPGLACMFSCAKRLAGSVPGATGESTVMAQSGATGKPGSTTGSRVSFRSQNVADDLKHLAVPQRFPDEDIHFDFDKSRLLPEAKENLRRRAKWLMAHPDFSVVIEGHCDERGMSDYNLALGDRRANRVKEYLVDLGVAPERLPTRSYGEERPVDPRHSEKAWAKNRRAHFE